MSHDEEPLPRRTKFRVGKVRYEVKGTPYEVHSLWRNDKLVDESEIPLYTLFRALDELR